MPAKQRTDGRYMVQVRYRDRDGKARRKSVYGRTKREAEAKAQQVRVSLALDGPVRDSRRSLAAWAADWVANLLRVSDRAESTRCLYRAMIREYVVPVIGDVPLGDLRPRDVAQVLLVAQDRLGPSSCRTLYAALRALLEDAVSGGLLASNPAKQVPRPRLPRKEARHLTPEEASRLLQAAQGLRYRRALIFLLLTGLRRGEVLSAHWEDLDLDQGRIRVRGTKSESSRRLVALSPAVVEVLRAQRTEQLAERLATDDWHDLGLVFTTRGGGPVCGRNLLREVQIAARKAGLAGVSVHSLRHTFATTALLGGVPVHVVSRTLGHSSTTITTEVYAHLTQQAEVEAVEVVSRAFQAANGWAKPREVEDVGAQVGPASSP